MEKLNALFKRRGFVYPGSELYGGLANTYDYGPIGTELLRNIKNLWWKVFVQKRGDMVGLDASLVSHHKIWDASGHTAGFSDALIDCRNCKSRFRADHLIEEALCSMSEESCEKLADNFFVPHLADLSRIKQAIRRKKVEGLTTAELSALINFIPIHCPACKELDWTEVRKFNLLFPLALGIVEGEQSLAYLRGETAQGMFINFVNIVNSTRVKLPFGIAQLGKSFRNEITLGNSVFRTLEFEQGEIEYFFDPQKDDWQQLFEHWKRQMWEFVTQHLGVSEDNLRWREHTDEERSFYSKRTEDLEYHFPFGFKELWGLAYRADYDLKQHTKYSGKDLFFVDPETAEKIIPHVIEPAVGINRLFLMVLHDAYVEEEERVVLKLHPRLAPYKVAVFPLLKNKPELIEKARAVYTLLKDSIDGIVVWDDRGNIGKRYLSQDEIGTPWCITIDFETLEDDSVTIRDRDTATQERIRIDMLATYISSRIA